MNYHNVRNSLGRFTRRVSRTSDGKFKSTTNPNKVVAGRLYDFRGATVRATNSIDGTGRRLVAFHKTLFGRVKDNQLKLINRRKVNSYLSA